MANRFCSGCGAKLAGSAKFCVECGAPQGGVVPPKRIVSHLTERYAPLFVLGSVLLIGAGAIFYGWSNPQTATGVPRREASGAPGQGGQMAGALPPDHPPIQIPDEVRKSISDLAKRAADAPDDIAAWKQAAEVQYRAAQLEPRYLTEAAASYRHILEKDPGNLDALRGLGNVAYDQQQPATAVGFYEQYLAKKPDDLDVLTDMGTMYLASANSQKAVETYQKVLKANPNFFQAQFNLAIAYRGLGDNEKMLAELEKARNLAPDEQARAQIDQLLARGKGAPAPAMGASENAAAPMGGMAAPAQPAAAAAPAADNFQAAAEGLFRQNPVMGPKVQKIEWSGSNAKVYLRGFPMDQMGADMKTMLESRLKGRIAEQKTKFQVANATTFELIDEASGRVLDTITE